MERIQALVVSLALITIGLGVWIAQPAYFFKNPAQQRGQGKEEEQNLCFPALFSFGSSVADTGTRDTAFPTGERGELLYGSTFFRRHSQRFSDGRMHIDFWATALGLPFLDPYLKSVGSNFRRGVNFAAAGATACNVTAWSPFYLSIQLNQFREFKRDVLAILEGPTTRNGVVDKLPLKSFFQDGLYMLAIGSNDINICVLDPGLTLQEIESRVPESTNELVRVLEALYAEGARHILVEDVYPVGCSSALLSELAAKYWDQLDDVGCLRPVNELVQLHNALLRKGIAELAKRLPDASIAVIDTYRRRYDIIANHDEYGFTNPLKACCGAGEPYNFRFSCRCGKSKMENGVPVTAGMCDNVSSHVWWDGLHFTDAFNRAIMKDILTGDYFETSFDLVRNGCELHEIECSGPTPVPKDIGVSNRFNGKLR